MNNGSYERQIESLFVAFVIKIPNAFTDFNLWQASGRRPPAALFQRSRRSYEELLLRTDRNHNTQRVMKSGRLSPSRFCDPDTTTLSKPCPSLLPVAVFVERRTRLFSLAAIWRLNVCGRPSRTPLSRAAASPAVIRSTITLRSNSATAARICICNRRQDYFRWYRSPVKVATRAALCLSNSEIN
jgi:hypothetical protein